MAEETKKKTIPTTTILLLVLPYLPPPTLAVLSLTSTTLHCAVSTLTTLRSSDASLGLEPHPIPFRNAVDSHPYAFFLYTPIPLLPHQPPPRRREGSGVGVGVRVEVVRCRRKGWGLFSLDGVRDGVFVCEYAGEYLTNTEARRRQNEYDKLAASSKFSPALIVLREHLPSGKACLRVNIDATRLGNVARFINHCCDGGNLSPVIVRNSGSVLPRLCFFAARDIEEGEELTFCYGDVNPRPNGAPCYCGSSGCLGMLPSEET